MSRSGFPVRFRPAQRFGLAGDALVLRLSGTSGFGADKRRYWRLTRSEVPSPVVTLRLTVIVPALVKV